MYVFYLFYDPALFADAGIKLVKVCLKALPGLFIAYFSLIIVHVFLHPENMLRHLKGRSKVKKWGTAVMGGLLSQGPAYLWYPLLAESRKNGASKGFPVVFLANKAINLAFLPTFILFFGFRYVLLLTILMIVSSILQGIVFERLEEKRSR